MKKILRRAIYIVMAGGCVLTGCTRATEPQYKIGFAQCLDDAWRQKMNEEMQRELLLHPQMTLQMRTAYGDNRLQCAQIDSFIRERVDLLIVSPNEGEAVKPAVSRAYRAGIPVIIADRRIPGDEYTAFIGGDNYQVGQLMAKWVISHNSHKVLEVSGMPGSTPEALRHKGLVEELKRQHADVNLQSVSGAKDAYAAVRTFLETRGEIDAIVAHNDLMAVDAAKAVKESERGKENGEKGRHVRIMGVDGIYDGLVAIRDSVIECTATYPSRGDLLIETAAQILAGEPFARDTVLATNLVDISTTPALIEQYEERIHDIEIFRLFKQDAQSHWQQLQTANRMLVIMVVVAGMLFLAAFCLMMVFLKKIHTEIKDDLLPQLEEVQEAIQVSNRDAAFVERVKEIVDEHLTDPDFSVEILGSMLQLSRTQVFRRVKKVTGMAPMDYIRERRLLRADELLRTSDKTIRQIALELCFNKPAYFSKCYKEYFGHLPSEVSC